MMTLKLQSYNYTFVLIIFFFFNLLFYGCYEQTDRISISSDGNIHVTTEVVVQDPKGAYDFSHPNDQIDELITELKQGGWRVTKQVLSKKRPFRFKIVSTGNLSSIAESGSLYRFRSWEKYGKKGQYFTRFYLINVASLEPSHRTVLVKTDNLFDMKKNLIKKINLPDDKNKSYFLRLK